MFEAIYHLIVGYVIPFFLLIATLVAIHEGGHFAAARALGIGVLEFSVGMGPVLLSRTDRSGCRWSLRAVPIGGFVKMVGDAGIGSAPDVLARLPIEDRPRAFGLRPPSHRAAVVVAGPLVNFVFGFAVMAAVFGFMGRPVTPPVLSKIVENSAAASAGLLAGDRVLEVDGTPVSRFEDLAEIVYAKADVTMDFKLLRDGREMHFKVTPRSEVVDDLGGKRPQGRIGVMGTDRVIEKVGFGDAVSEGARGVFDLTKSTIGAVYDMVTLRKPLADMGGPVKIAEVSGDALSKYGIASFVLLVAAISVNLGVMNLMPLPILDGGHLVLFALEAARGKPVDPLLVARLFKGGVVALLLLGAMITLSDIVGVVNRVMS